MQGVCAMRSTYKYNTSVSSTSQILKTFDEAPDLPSLPPASDAVNGITESPIYHKIVATMYGGGSPNIAHGVFSFSLINHIM